MGLPTRIDAWLSNARAFQLFQLLRQGGLIVIAIALAHSGLALEQIDHTTGKNNSCSGLRLRDADGPRKRENSAAPQTAFFVPNL